MRLLIALPDAALAELIRNLTEDRWKISLARDGQEVLPLLSAEPCDLLLLHFCLPLLNGQMVGNQIASASLLCPPRIVYLCPPECCRVRPSWADATLSSGLSPLRLIRFLELASQKPLPKLAAVHSQDVARATEAFLDEIGMSPRYKGRWYAAWLLKRMIPSPLWDDSPLGQMYLSCATHFGVSAASVERCLRVAVESVFTLGSMDGIDHFFGATVDPEKGKPTNRAFLLQACTKLREDITYSLAVARSPNSSVMHHSPAAPTSV